MEYARVLICIPTGNRIDEMLKIIIDGKSFIIRISEDISLVRVLDILNDGDPVNSSEICSSASSFEIPTEAIHYDDEGADGIFTGKGEEYDDVTEKKKVGQKVIMQRRLQSYKIS